MKSWKERRFLAALVAAQNKTAPSARRRRMLHVLTWFALVFSLLLVFQFFGVPSLREWFWAGGAFVVGVLVGAIAVFDGSKDQWPWLRPHIDFQSVKSRLSELES